MKSYALISTWAAYAAAQAASPIAMKAGTPAPADFAKIQMVMVGGFSPAASPGGQPTPQFQFTPESVVAQPGDTVRFMFMGMNHSVVQTSFDAPCQPMANGFTSGVQPNPSNQLAGAPTVDLPIKSTDPLFMSTLSTQSCNLGMVFTVNPPQDRNLVLFKSNALKSSVAGTLKNAQIIAAGAPPAQVASTISIAPQGNGNAAATPAAPGGPQASGVQQGGAAPSVIAGQGQTGNGQACGCMCLCGAGSFPANAGQGAFGGTLGAMPEMGGMAAPQGTPPMQSAPPAGTAMPAAPQPGQPQGQQQPQMAMPNAGAAVSINVGPPPAGAPPAANTAVALAPAMAPPVAGAPAPAAKFRKR